VRGITRKDMRIYCAGVHRLNSLVLLVKVCWIQGRDLESEAGKVFRSNVFEYTSEKRRINSFVNS